MSNENGRPWYRKPAIVISAIVIILAAIIGATWGPLLSSWLNPPPPDFSISVNPMRGEVHQGGVIQTTVTVMGIHGYEHPVSLSASGQPSGVVVTFIPPIGGPTPSYTSTVTINVQPSVSADVYTTIIKGMGADGKEYSCKYILSVISEAEIIEDEAEIIEDEANEVQEYKYAASKKSEVFHYITCSYVSKIKPENLILFKTREQAIASGRRPCKKCKP